MNIKQVKLSPDLANEWLQTITPDKQRVLREKHVMRLLNAIKMNEWRHNNDLFMFDAQGVLRNGQHRAAAVAKSGRTITVLVAFDCTEDECLLADQGAMARRNNDALHFAGFKNTTSLAAIINTILRDVECSRFSPSPDECIAFAKKHEEMLAFAVTLSGRAKKQLCPLEGAILAAVWFVGAQVDRAAADSFGLAVAYSMPKVRGDAVFSLLRRLKENRERSVARLGRQTKVAITIKAFNFWRENKHPQFLRWSPGQNEEFPSIR